MKKIKLLITSAALLVGGGLLASSSNNIMKANAAEGDVITTFDSDTVVSNSGYQEYSNDSWIVTCGGNNKSVGSNSSNSSKLTLSGDYASIGKNISLSSKTAAVISKEPIANVGNLILKRSSSGAGSYDSSKYFVLSSTTIYSDSTADYQLVSEGSFSSTDIEIPVNIVDAKYYAIVFTSSSWFRLDNVVASFKEGPDQSTKYNVNFYDGDSLIFTDAVKDGDSVDFSLVDTEKDGYVFDGWYEDPEFNIAYDEDAPVTSDLNLYAHYIAHENLTNGEIFASETTKTSLIANTTSTITEYTEELKIVEDAPLESLFEYTIVKTSGGSNPSKVYSDSWRVYGGNTITLSSEYTIDHITYKTDKGKDDLITSIKELTDGASIESTGNHIGTITVNSKSFSFSLGSQSRITEFTIFYSNFETVQVTNASIRFGTALSSKLYDETATYGVIFGLNGEDINTLAENETSVENLLINNKTLHSAQASNIAMVDTDTGAVEESKNPEIAPYFQYAIVIKDMLEHISEEITAACYMETNDNLYVMNEVTYSVKTLSDEYLNNIEEGTLSEDYKDILNAILNYNA